ncbi:MAG: hypothetical protein ABR881_28915 [Candidatus Sulfotelmatobacter sp.]|jgi:hypothetical protein
MPHLAHVQPSSLTATRADDVFTLFGAEGQKLQPIPGTVSFSDDCAQAHQVLAQLELKLDHFAEAQIRGGQNGDAGLAYFNRLPGNAWLGAIHGDPCVDWKPRLAPGLVFRGIPIVFDCRSEWIRKEYCTDTLWRT